MILITGATGLTGSHLALHLLENGATSIRAIYRNQQRIEKTRSLFARYQKSHLFDKIEWVHADILNVSSLEVAFRGIERVFHCAALVSFDPKDHERLRKNNIEGTANVVNFCLHYGIKKLCHVSSIAALGDLKDNETTITEESEWNPEKPHTDYAISKFGAEMEIWRGQQEGLNIVIVNPGIILGAGFPESESGKIFSYVTKGMQFYTKGTSSFVSVFDVVKIMSLLMESEITGERFIISAETLSFREVLNKIADAMKLSRPSIYAKPWVTTLAWKFDWILANFLQQERKISHDNARALHAEISYSGEKLQKAIDFKFQMIKETIQEIVAKKY